jgi:hypothetical protein
MITRLIRTLPLAVFLLFAASGCEFIQFESPLEPTLPPYGSDPGDGGPTGPQPLYPFRPGSIWQYTVTALDGSKGLKFVSIDKQTVMVGGFGEHQLEMAYPVRTSHAPGAQPYLVRMQQAVGDRIVNYREASYNHLAELVLDVNWDPQQLEIDQSSERTRPGVTWQENYKGDIRHLGGMVSSIRRNEIWKVVGQEVLTLPGIERAFQTTVFQKLPATAEPDGGAVGSDAGRAPDAGVRPPVLTGETLTEAVDGGVMIPKTLWYARGFGKVKEAGGGEPTEELSGLELK